MDNNDFKGTPGPWYAVEYSGFINLNNEPFYEGKNLLDADAVGYTEALANGHLAASAPKLLSGLIEAREALQNLGRRSCFDSGGFPCECSLCKINRIIEDALTLVS